MVPVGFTSEGGIKTQKSPFACVCHLKIWLKSRMTFLFASADRYDPKHACQYTGGALETNRKFFHATQTSTSCSLKFYFQGSKMVPVGFTSERGIKIQKSPFACVCHLKIWLKSRMTFLFASADRYDPKHACQYTGGALETNRKFFHATQTSTSCSLKLHFQGSKMVPVGCTSQGGIKIQ